jgi:hypothetical protein
MRKHATRGERRGLNTSVSVVLIGFKPIRKAERRSRRSAVNSSRSDAGSGGGVLAILLWWWWCWRQAKAFGLYQSVILVMIAFQFFQVLE